MHTSVAAFMEGFFASGVLCLAYIHSLRAKIASYRLYFARRLDAQTSDLRNRPRPDEGPSDGGRRIPRTPPRGPSPAPGVVTTEGLRRLSSLVSPRTLNSQKPVTQHE